MGDAQGWQWLNPSPNGNNVASVAWRTPTSLWVAGSWGGAIVSDDAGVTWKDKLIAPGYSITALRFLDPGKGWLLGAGVVFRTADSGKTWQQVATGAPAGTVFYDIVFATGTSTGWIAGSSGVVMRTTNGGTSWSRVTTGTTASLTGISCADDKNAWVCGSAGNIYRTTNSGTNWAKQTINTTAWLRDIAATSAQNIKVVGDGGRIYTSTNGGGVWAAANTNTTRNFNALTFSDYLRGLAVGDGGTTRLTEDGGSTWSTPTVPLASNLTCAAATASGMRWAIAGAGGSILTSEDGGRTWTARSSGSTTEFLGASFVDSLYGWVSGRLGEIWRTTNGGAAWTKCTTGTAKNINAIYFLNRTTGWAIGDTLLIMKTTNGGTSWATESAPVTAKVNLYDVKFIDANSGWICGSTGAYLFRTTNGGAAWTTVYTSLSQTVQLRRMAIKSPSLWAVGNGGAIFQTFDNGQTWKSLTTGTSAALYGIAFQTQLKGVACGAGGTIIQTTNGGSNWTALTSGTTQTLLDIRANGDTLRACGTSGALMRSTNFGGTWLFAQPLVTANQMNVLSTVNGRTAFAAGQNGTILKSYQPQSALSSSRRVIKFDSLQVDSCGTIDLTLYNVGDASLDVDSVFLLGIDTLTFAVHHSATLPTTLQSGDSLPVTVSFCPKDSGDHAIELIVYSSSSSSPDRFNVSGYAGRLAYALPDTLAFGLVDAGGEADSVVTLYNTGTLVMHIASVTIDGPEAAVFTLNGTFTNISLMPGDSLPLRVFFSPLSAGVKEATLHVALQSGPTISMELLGNWGGSGVAEPVAGVPMLSVVPQPAGSDTRVMNAGERVDELRIVDILGRDVWRAARGVAPGATLALPSLRPGMYTLVARANGRVAARPFIVGTP